MEDKEYQNVFGNEARHFYYRSLHRLLLTLLRSRFDPNGSPYRLLDAGCGAGLMAQKLQEFGQVWGIDVSDEALKFSLLRGVKAQYGSVDKVPFADNFFDAVVSVDVLCQAGVDDQKALSEFFRVLRPGGLLLLRLPANEFLRRSHDLYVHSQRRYSRGPLQEMVKKSGFKNVKCSYWGFSLLLPVFIKAVVEKLVPPKLNKSEIGPVNPKINRLFLSILNLENLILRKVSLPQGIGLIIYAQK